MLSSSDISDFMKEAVKDLGGMPTTREMIDWLISASHELRAILEDLVFRYPSSKKRELLLYLSDCFVYIHDMADVSLDAYMMNLELDTSRIRVWRLCERVVDLVFDTIVPALDGIDEDIVPDSIVPLQPSHD